MIMNRKFALIVLSALTLTSCARALPLQSSGITPPSLWSRMTHADTKLDLNSVIIADDKASVEHQWWMHFKDDTLNALVKEAVANNKNLGMAKARVEEAWANMGYAKANQLPQIDGVVKPKRGNEGLATGDKPKGQIDLTLQATWELDVFGRNLPRLAQTEAILQSADASQQAVLVGLLAEVGRNYFDLRDYQKQIELTQKNLENQRKTLELIKAQQKGALVGDFDVQRASAQVSTTESKLPALKTAYEVTLNRLNVLLGAAPGEKDKLIQTEVALQPLDQRIIVAAPATVLANRPDVKVAERDFAASISNKKAAEKLIFPKITLLTFFGVQESNVLATYPWSMGITLIQPVLDFGRIKTQINAANAQQHQAFLHYQETVLEALENMENALTAYKNEVIRNGLLRTSYEQNRKAADLAEQQFQGGAIGLLDVLVAQNNVLEAESALADSDASLRKDLVSIYAAAGGGWQVE